MNDTMLISILMGSGLLAILLVVLNAIKWILGWDGIHATLRRNLATGNHNVEGARKDLKEAIARFGEDSPRIELLSHILNVTQFDHLEGARLINRLSHRQAHIVFDTMREVMREYNRDDNDIEKDILSRL